MSASGRLNQAVVLVSYQHEQALLDKTDCGVDDSLATGGRCVGVDYAHLGRCDVGGGRGDPRSIDLA